jgi:hypothetical protein
MLQDLKKGVGRARGYRLGGQDSIPGRDKRFFFAVQRSGWFWGPTGGFFTRDKAAF